MGVLSLNIALYSHVVLPYIMGFDIKINHQRVHPTHSHVLGSHHCNYCHHCNVDFVLIHNVTCYTNSPLYRIHVNTTRLLNITFTLVVTSVILRSLECICLSLSSSHTK